MASPANSDNREVADQLITEAISTGHMTLISGAVYAAGTKEFDAMFRLAMEIRRETPRKKQGSVNPDSLKLAKTAKESAS